MIAEPSPEFYCFACGRAFGPDAALPAHDDDCPVIATALRRLQDFAESRRAGLHPLETDAVI